MVSPFLRSSVFPASSFCLLPRRPQLRRFSLALSRARAIPFLPLLSSACSRCHVLLSIFLISPHPPHSSAPVKICFLHPGAAVPTATPSCLYPIPDPIVSSILLETTSCNASTSSRFSSDLLDLTLTLKHSSFTLSTRPPSAYPANVLTLLVHNTI